MKFFLGTHKPGWLGRKEFRDVPLFVSNRTLAPRKRLPRAVTSWSLDSGGFSELDMYGAWRTTPAEYVDAVRRYVAEIGRLDWAAPQDWMCEDRMIAKTGLTVERHQELTVESVQTLRQLGPELEIIDVLQGKHPHDYIRHVEMYAAAGIDLRTKRVVGLGSVCRRQATTEIQALVRELTAEGIRLHTFGGKTLGLRKYGHLVESSDSLGWSFRARRAANDVRKAGSSWRCPFGHGHASCANCPDFALAWRSKVLKEVS